MNRTPTSGRWPHVIVPAVGALWAALHLRDSYFFYDEWSMINRVLVEPAAAGTVASFNGHLWMLQYWLYRIQVNWFGVDDRAFICITFVCALIALHVALAAVLRASGLRSMTSLLLAGTLTYLGAASQNFIYSIQVSPTLSLAATLAAAAIALARPPSPARAALVGILMLVAVGIDSAIALVGVSFTAIVVVLAWGRRATIVIVPALLALGGWFVAGDLGPKVPATLGTRAAFAGHLLLHASGGLIGQGELAGASLLLLAVAGIAFGVYSGHVTGPARIALTAGTLATALIVAALAQSRAGLPGFDFENFNRYLQTVAIPATLALAPGLAATGRALLARRPRLARTRLVMGVAPAIVVVAFLLGLVPMRAYARAFLGWNAAVERGVQTAAAVIRDGCPGGDVPAPARQPLGELSPQITTALLRQLMQRGALHAAARIEPEPTVVDRMCSDVSTATRVAR